MDDLDVLARDFGFGTRGKSNPMRSTATDRRSIDDPLFSDVFGGEPKYTQSLNPKSTANQMSGRDFDYDSIFKSSAATDSNSNSSSSKISLPVYDKPVYDDDLFDGLPGLKTKSTASTVKFDDDVFASVSISKSVKSRNQGSDFDDLLGNLGRNEKFREENINGSSKSSSSSKGFDELLAGFGSGSSPARNRPTPELRWGSMPTNQRSTLGDPFVVVETSSTSHSPSGVSTDPLEEIGKLNKSRSARADVSHGSTGAFDDLDPLSSFGKSENSFSSMKDNSWSDGGHGNSPPQSATSQEPMGNFPYGYSESTVENNVPLDSFQEPQLFDMPNDLKDFQKFGQTTSSPQYYETGSISNTPPASDSGRRQFDDIWLTVSEIPLFTQPSSAPPPSRPPPPIPHRTTRSETGSFPSNYRKKGVESSSTSNHGQRFQSPKLGNMTDRGPTFSQFDEPEDFSVSSSQSNSDGTSNPYSSLETNTFSTAAASAAAMKYAMDKAEAKFRHAKEVHEREHAKVARNNETGPLENDEQDEQEKESKETQERLERERKQKEEEGREQRRLEREILKEIEKEKARQAVERATHEAREREQRRLEREILKEIEKEMARQAVERATREARERAAADARLKAERAAVGKVNAEARERAERAAVQRAQAEARERAAAEAKERVERAAAEVRERAATEAREREKEEREKAARADAEARRRAERAAVERATAEARGRAAAEARERAAAAARMNQQKNDNDLESFFSSGRASSAPKARTYSTDPLSEQFQNKAAPEPAKRTPPSTGTSSSMKKASSTTNFVDDLSSIFGAAPSSGDFQDVEGETEDRRRARLDRHQRTQERAAKALAEKNQRDLQAQREQEERHRYAEMLDTEIKRWAAGKEGNLRALLSTLHYALWPECGWQPVSLTDLITGVSVKKVYRKATLCIHPDKVQQKGATLQQKYIAEKVFDLLKEAWNKFNSEELF